MGAAKFTEDNERILTEREAIKYDIIAGFGAYARDVNRGAWKPAPKTNKKK